MGIIPEMQSWGRALSRPPDLSFASTVFGQNRPRDAPCSSFQPPSNHPPTFFPVATFGISHSAILSFRNQPTPFFELNSILPINHELPDSSELFH